MFSRGTSISDSQLIDHPGDLTFLLLLTCFFCTFQQRFIFPHGFPLKYQPVLDGISCCRVLHQTMPFIYRELAHHDGAALLVSVFDDLRQVVTLRFVSSSRPRSSRINTSVFCNCCRCFSQLPSTRPCASTSSRRPALQYCTVCFCRQPCSPSALAIQLFP